LGDRIPDSRFQIPDSRFQISDFRFQILESRESRKSEWQMALSAFLRLFQEFHEFQRFQEGLVKAIGISQPYPLERSPMEFMEIMKFLEFEI
jgi:hypothetical protein